jgi:rare lipoprotein A
MGTHVRVTNLNNGRAATVVIVDRGPFIRNRIIDVSTRAADLLGFRQAGVARVRLDVVDR